jgi:hypothetical protein
MTLDQLMVLFGFNPGFTPFYITNAGVNPGLNLGFGVLKCGPCTVGMLSFFMSCRQMETELIDKLDILINENKGKIHLFVNYC